MRKWIWIMGLVLAVALTGCIKVDQVITLNKDGSGNVKLTYGMSEQSIKQMEAMADMSKQMAEQQGEEAPEDEKPFEFDEDEIAQDFKDLAEEGITLNSVDVEEKDGWKYVNVDFDFADIGKLDSTDMFDDNPITLAKNADGNYVITADMSGGDMGGDQNKEQMKAMLPMFKGMRIAMKLKTPTDIISTTAPIKEKQSAQWVFDVDEDPDSFLNMSETKMEVVFKGAGVNIPEMK